MCGNRTTQREKGDIMTQEQHFYSFIASARYGANETDKARIDALFQRGIARPAEVYLKEIAAIIGQQAAFEIIESLRELERNGTIT